MDKKEFYRQLRQIDEEVQHRDTPVASLSKEQVKELDAAVHTHIQTLFPEDAPEAKRPGLLATLKSSLRCFASIPQLLLATLEAPSSCSDCIPQFQVAFWMLQLGR